jgi:membrane-bound ClpP family serine protease
MPHDGPSGTTLVLLGVVLFLGGALMPSVALWIPSVICLLAGLILLIPEHHKDDNDAS